MEVGIKGFKMNIKELVDRLQSRAYHDVDPEFTDVKVMVYNSHMEDKVPVDIVDIWVNGINELVIEVDD